jgi:hypothetical protein
MHRRSINLFENDVHNFMLSHITFYFGCNGRGRIMQNCGKVPERREINCGEVPQRGKLLHVNLVRDVKTHLTIATKIKCNMRKHKIMYIVFK